MENRQTLKRLASRQFSSRVINDETYPSSFLGRLGLLYEEDPALFADIFLVFGEEKIPVHRIILSAFSDYFKVLFKIHEGPHIPIHDVSSDVFRCILHYACTGKVVITTDNVQDLLIAANFFGSTSLIEKASEFMLENIEVENAIDVFEFANHYAITKLADGSKRFVVENFSTYIHNEEYKARLLQVSPHILESIVKSDELIVWSKVTGLMTRAVDRERIVLELILEYLMGESERERYTLQLLKCIKWPVLAKDEEFSSNTIKTLNHGKHENSIRHCLTAGELAFRRHLPINWAAASDTTLSTSSNYTADHGAQHALPGATNPSFWLSRSPVPQWFCVQFATPINIGNVQITPWIQGFSDVNPGAPSTFRIEGSNDNTNWTTLYQNETETALGGVNCIYAIEPQDSNKKYLNCRIYIEMTRDGIGEHACIHNLIINDNSVHDDTLRQFTFAIAHRSKLFAGGGQAGHEGLVFCLVAGDEEFITEIKITTRLWDGREVLRALGLTFSSGRQEEHGGEGGIENTFHIHLAQGEHIISASLNSGWMIDNLTFTSLTHGFNQRDYGPYGGDGGASRDAMPTLLSQKSKTNPYEVYLIGFEGRITQTQGQGGITHLRFIWKEVLKQKLDWKNYAGKYMITYEELTNQDDSDNENRTDEDHFGFGQHFGQHFAQHFGQHIEDYEESFSEGDSSDHDSLNDIEDD